MKVNSPMLGQVDFSLIPAYFIDDATIYHGASSVGVTGGGLGGAVTLATKAPAEQGLGLRYVPGHRVVRHVRRIPAPDLRRRAVEQFDARALQHLGQ